MPLRAALVLAAYAFLSNVALAVVPHEPAIVWYGPRLGVWITTLVATAASVVAAWVDHRLFVPLIRRIAGARPSFPLSASRRGGQGVRSAFQRAPFAILALSGLTPLPFFPFKALALATGYPLGRYLAAVTARSLPRYALLAWLGVAVRIPTWALALAFVMLSLPTVRLLWPRPA